MRQQSDPIALHAHTAAETAAFVSRVDAEIGKFVEALTRQFQEKQADVEALQHQLREREVETEHLKTLLVKARMDLDATKTDLAAERENAHTTRAAVAQMAHEFDRALDEMRREHAAVLAEQSAVCTALPLDELLSVFHALAKAPTPPELQHALLTSLAREFSRVALFHIDGTRLVAAERRGFSDEDTSKPIRLAADSLLTRAVSTGRLEGLILGVDGESSGGLPFGGTPGCALALPIVDDGAIAAVIYADDSDHMAFASGSAHARLKFAELVHQHALLVMVRISAEGRGSQDLRGLAASLVAKLEFNYTVQAERGRNRLECQQRLKAALQAARRRYAQRAGADSEAVGLLDDQLASTVAAKKDSPFGSDLEALLDSARTRGDRGGHAVAISRSR